MGLLDGKVALVTGAGTGIGREAAILLASDGARVVLTGRRLQPLQDVAARIEAEGGTAVAAPSISSRATISSRRSRGSSASRPRSTFS